MKFDRYAIYYTPQGSLAEAGAAWLGWDVARGRAVAHPEVAGLDVAALTQTPRKYGLHATIKPPFVLAEGTTADGLLAEFEALCTRLSPVTLDGLALTPLGRFLALTPEGDTAALNAMAAEVVRGLAFVRRPEFRFVGVQRSAIGADAGAVGPDDFTGTDIDLGNRGTTHDRIDMFFRCVDDGPVAPVSWDRELVHDLPAIRIDFRDPERSHGR